MVVLSHDIWARLGVSGLVATISWPHIQLMPSSKSDFKFHGHHRVATLVVGFPLKTQLVVGVPLNTQIWGLTHGWPGQRNHQQVNHNLLLLVDMVFFCLCRAMHFLLEDHSNFPPCF